MLNIIILVAIIAAIAYGFIFKKNSGFIAIAFSFLIGCFLMGMKPSEVIACWPIKVFFYVFAVTVFFNFSRQNGTLEKLSMKILYLFRERPKSLLFVLFFLNLLIAAMGVGNMPVEAMFAPIMIMVCAGAKISYLMGALAVNFGSIAGANFITSVNGMVFRSLIDEAGMPELSLSIAFHIFIVSIISPLVILLIYHFMQKRHEEGVQEKIDIQKTKPFSAEQKRTLKLMALMLAVVLSGPIVKFIFSSNATVSSIFGKFDVSLIAMCFVVIASMLGVGDEKKAIAGAPWGTLILISGVGMLINIASKAGLMEVVANWVTGNIPTVLVPIALVLIGAFMSFFSSTIGVVSPVIFPMLPDISSLTGLEPTILFVSLVIGAQASSISPFSAAGSMLVSACTDEKTSAKLFKEQILAIPFMVVMALLASVVLMILYGGV